MAKHLRLIALIGFFIFGLCALSFAQSTESVSITTYYPSPYGVYRTMRLHPGPRPTGACQNGEIYYDDGSDAIPNPIGLYVCNTGAWAMAGSGSGSSWWAENPAGSSNIVNTNIDNVTIGTNATLADDHTLTVKGTVQLKGGGPGIGELAFYNGTGFFRTLDGGYDNPYGWPKRRAGDFLFNPWDGVNDHPCFIIKETGNAFGIGDENLNPNLAGHQPGRTVLTIQGKLANTTGAWTNEGVLELSSGATDAADKIMGQYSFVARENSGEKRIAAIAGLTEGATAYERGGVLAFYTRTGGVLTEQMRMNSVGSVAIGTTTFEGYSPPRFVVENLPGVSSPIQIQGPADVDKDIVWREYCIGEEWKWRMHNLAGDKRFSAIHYDNSTEFERFSVLQNGWIGIGLTPDDPWSPFHLRGNLRADKVAVLVENTHNVTGESRSAGVIYKGTNGIEYAMKTDCSLTGTNSFCIAGGENQTGEGKTRIYIDGETGYVGIGTSNPGEKLDVHGAIHVHPLSSQPSTANFGDIYMNNSTNHLYFYDGSAWQLLD